MNSFYLVPLSKGMLLGAWPFPVVERSICYTSNTLVTQLPVFSLIKSRAVFRISLMGAAYYFFRKVKNDGAIRST